jgi:hypothetical protein
LKAKTILIMGRRKRGRRKKTVDDGLVAGWRRERAST